MAFKISAVKHSIVRHIVDCIDGIKADGISAELDYFAFESRGEKAELETIDLMGLAGWSFHENRGLWVVRCGLNISTINDENLFREDQIIDAVHDMFGEKCVVPLRDPDTGEEYTQLVVEEFELMPASYSEKRNFRPIGLELLRTSNDG